MHVPTDTRSQADWDTVTQAAIDSFPASDPPTWPGLRLGPPAPDASRTSTQAEDKSDDSRLRIRNSNAGHLR